MEWRCQKKPFCFNNVPSTMTSIGSKYGCLKPTRRYTMSFDSFLSKLKSKASELKTEALKYKNKDFLNAAMAGSALIAMADGSVSAEEKQKMVKFIDSNDALSVFTTTDVIKAFQEYVGQLEFDKDIGEAKAYQALRMIIAVASSDGNFDANEQRVASKIARELGLTPAEFELQ